MAVQQLIGASNASKISLVRIVAIGVHETCANHQPRSVQSAYILIICIQDTAFKFWLNLSSYLCGGRGRGVGPRGGGIREHVRSYTHVYNEERDTRVHRDPRHIHMCTGTHIYILYF